MKTHLVIHHSLTADGDTLTWPVIRRNHQALGYLDISYHVGFEWFQRDSTDGHYEALLGRPFDAQAAAAWQNGMNRYGIHALFVGDYDKAPPPDDMIAFAAGHLAPICGAFDIPPTAQFIIGHRDVAPYKSCPGTQFPMAQLIESIRRLS